MIWGRATKMKSESIRRYIRACADVFFPRLCVVCGTRLALDEQQLCISCLHQLPLVRFASFTENPMADRFVGLFPIVRAASCFHYQKGATVNRILFDLKYMTILRSVMCWGVLWDACCLRVAFLMKWM